MKQNTGLSVKLPPLGVGIEIAIEIEKFVGWVEPADTLVGSAHPTVDYSTD